MRMMSHFNLSLERGGVGKVQDVRWRVGRNMDKKLMGWETLITHLTLLFKILWGYFKITQKSSVILWRYWLYLLNRKAMGYRMKVFFYLKIRLI